MVVSNNGVEQSKQRILVVANRLPISVVRKGEATWSFQDINVGGLYNALLDGKEFEVRWVGWAGLKVPDEEEQKALTKALAAKGCIPVFLDQDNVHQHYEDYCNNELWPSFNCLALSQEADRVARTSYESRFPAYKKANEIFADVVKEHYERGDVVWCHDYHLMFLPEFLKSHNKEMKVGWFLHTPFPSFDQTQTSQRTLSTELVKAVLAADLVGFHTNDDAANFLSTCARIQGLRSTPQVVENDQGKRTRVAVFHVGIDSERLISALGIPQVQDNIRAIKETYHDRKIILGVDMLKGTAQNMLAFQKFLEENRKLFEDKVVLYQIVLPTRTDMPESEHLELIREVNEIYGRVNCGTLTAHMHLLALNLPALCALDLTTVDFHALCALYVLADVGLMTSLGDGMNFFSHEYVASHKNGVLILNEFASTAQSLGDGSILVNPWNINEVVGAIKKALEMPDEERKDRYQKNSLSVKTHTATKWAENFIRELNDTVRT